MAQLTSEPHHWCATSWAIRSSTSVVVSLAKAEAGHAELFRDLALTYENARLVETRLDELAEAEAKIVAALPLVPRVH